MLGVFLFTQNYCMNCSPWDGGLGGGDSLACFSLRSCATEGDAPVCTRFPSAGNTTLTLADSTKLSIWCPAEIIQGYFAGKVIPSSTRSVSSMSSPPTPTCGTCSRQFSPVLLTLVTAKCMVAMCDTDEGLYIAIDQPSTSKQAIEFY